MGCVNILAEKKRFNVRICMDPEGIGIRRSSRNEPFSPPCHRYPAYGWALHGHVPVWTRHHQSVVAPHKRTLVSVPIKEVWRGSLALGLGQPLCWRR